MTTLAAELESLWTDYHARITGYITKNIHDNSVIEDLVSSVFLRACVAMSHGNGCTDSVSGWMFQIARSVMWDYLRAKRRATFVGFEECEECPDPGAQPDEATERKMHGEHVRGVVARLPERQAWSISLRLDGLENEEIAQLCGSDVTVVRQINTRAYKNLRQRLQEAA